jgi:hypothetical protein
MVRPVSRTARSTRTSGLSSSCVCMLSVRLDRRQEAWVISWHWASSCGGTSTVVLLLCVAYVRSVWRKKGGETWREEGPVAQEEGRRGADR